MARAAKNTTSSDQVITQTQGAAKRRAKPAAHPPALPGELVAAIHRKAAELGKLAVRMTAKAGSGHPSSGLSLAHIVTSLMYRQMRWDPANPWHPTADRLVLSEGHAVPIIYAALADLGATIGKDRDSTHKLTVAEVDTLRQLHSLLDGHPNPAEGVHFFDAATGSLGQGLSVAAGLALGARLDGSDRRIYVLIGDGESREGQNWEAADFIVDHKLTNICAIFNSNGQGQADHVSAQQSAATLVAKLQAFNWEVVEINGHDPDEIAAALAKFAPNAASSADAPSSNARPFAIVAHTVKGWGVDELLKGNWHGKPLKESEVAAAEASLDRAVAQYAVAADSPPSQGGAGGGSDALGAPPPPPPAAQHAKRGNPHDAPWPSFEEAMTAGGLKSVLEKGKMATRRAYGAALKVAGDLLPQVVALDGDVSNSTFSDIFGKAHPERFFECKIAEQNMVSAAAGLSAGGVHSRSSNSFAKFFAPGVRTKSRWRISRGRTSRSSGSHAGYIARRRTGRARWGCWTWRIFRAFGDGARRRPRKRRCAGCSTRPTAWRRITCTRLMVEQPRHVLHADAPAGRAAAVYGTFGRRRRIGSEVRAGRVQRAADRRRRGDRRVRLHGLSGARGGDAARAAEHPRDGDRRVLPAAGRREAGRGAAEGGRQRNRGRRQLRRRLRRGGSGGRGVAPV